MSPQPAASNVVWIAPTTTTFACLCERCLGARRDRGSFLDAVDVSVVRGSIELDADVAFTRCRNGQKLIVRRVDRPPNLAARDSRQLQLV